MNEVTTISDLKTKTVGDIFYLSLSLLRPGVMTFPHNAFSEARKKDAPSFNNGRAARDTNTPVKVVLGYDHRYVVYHDDYDELFFDVNQGAQSMPVHIVQDDSQIYEEKIFWEKMHKEDIAYTKWPGVKTLGKVSSKDNDEIPMPPQDVRNLPNDAFLSTLTRYIPLIKWIKKDSASLKTIMNPIAIRIEGKTSPFVIYKMAPFIQKRIELDEKKRTDERNFDDKSKNITNLMRILTEDAPELTLKELKRLQEIIQEAYSEGDFFHIPNFTEGVKIFKDVHDISQLNIPLLSDVSDQINIITVGKKAPD